MQTGSVAMGRTLGPERAHFGGEDGLIIRVIRGKTAYSWACAFCKFEIGGQCFPNRKARIHLSGNSELRDGTISQLCTKAPDVIKKQFSAIEIAKRKKKDQENATRKRAAELMDASPEFVQQKPKTKRQSKLGFNRLGSLKANEVDDAWAKCFCALDIAPNKMESPFFKAALEATRKSPSK